MKRRHKFKIYLFIFAIASSLTTRAQEPTVDPNFELLFQEDFSSLNPSIWNQIPSMTWGYETFQAQNVVFNSIDHSLELTCEMDSSIEDFNSGGIESIHKKEFGYGYFEVETKVPVHYRGPWGGFWLQSGDYYSEGEEIDIFEPNGCMTEANQYYNVGTRYYEYNIFASVIQTNGYPLSNYNKIAACWTPRKVQYYFNDKNVNRSCDAQFEENQRIIPENRLFMFLTFQIDSAGCRPIAAPSGPMKWYFKNLKYYGLKINCTQDKKASNVNFGTFDYRVYRTISLSNSSLLFNSRVFLHATDEITLTNFIVPKGSTLECFTYFNQCPEP
ncbi:MAG: hypothetical protein RLZZ91_1621 [Bacteroidota bacterium]